MSDKVVISFPEKDDMTISRSALGLWRRKGWVLKEDSVKAKNHLKSLGESKKEDVTEASDNSEGVS